MTLMLDTWYLFVRNLRNTMRVPMVWTMSIIQPLVWLLLFTQIFKNVALLPGFPAESYLAFLAPGIIVMTSLFGATFSGMGTLVDRDLGYLDKMLVTPVNRNAIILGRLGGDVIRVVIQAVLIMLIVLAMGEWFATGFPGFLLTIVIVALMVIAFAGFSNIVALKVSDHQLFIITVNFFTLPLIFMSSAMMPLGQQPGWMQAVATYNPVTYAVDGIRSLMISGFEGMVLAKTFIILGGVALFMMGIATIMFRRRLV